MKVSVVILNWNGKNLLEKFLPSVIRFTNTDSCQIVVADNGSTDNSILFLKEKFPTIKIIENGKNYGFAEGYNVALSQIESEYVVLLNSDVEVTENWLQPLITYLDNHKEAAAAQPKILSERNKSYFEYAGAAGGFIDKYGYPFCRGRIFKTVEKDEKQYNDITPIFWASGACMVVRLKDFNEAGGLDATFFAHMEEIDLCWRLNARGKKLACIPYSTVYHLGGGTLAEESPRKTFLNFRNNLLMLYKNLPEEKLVSVLLIRFILDNVAAIQILLSGKYKNANAVWKAQREFYNIKNNYLPQRIENLQKTIVKDIPTLYPKSILWDYYVKGIKTFSKLKNKETQK